MRSSSFTTSSSPFLMSLCDDDDFDGIMRRRLFCREKKGRATKVVGASSSSSLASPKAAVAASKGVARRTRRRRLLKESSSSLRRRTTCERRVDAAATKVDDDDKNGVTAAARTTFLRPQKSRKRFAPTAAAALLLALTASALLFPETSLAKAKAAAVENSAAAGFSFKVILDWILHLDKHLVELFATSGKMAYGVLFAIIFAETGFVVTPFLPGDSLLFACGALGALGVLNFPLVFGLLFVAAVLGDTVNYTCGAFLGQVAIEKNPKIFKPEYIAKTRTFYDKYGGRTVVLARFFVIVRTFAPFIAGVAKMNYSKFALYNVLGAGVWISSFMGLGYFFGNVPVVKENFATTILVIIVLSLLPVIFEVVNHKKDSTASA
jgi:membrane-associated protein